MATMNKTGAWIMITNPPNVEIPIDKFSIFYASPKEPYLRGSRTVAGHHQLMHRTPSGVPVHKFQEYIYQHLTGDEKEIPYSLRDDIKFLITKYDYCLDDYVSAVEIVTPFGTCKIFEEEYNEVTLEKALDFVEAGSHTIRYLSNSGTPQKKMKQTSTHKQLFYLQSRGISFTKAMKLISGDIKTQYLMYFDPLPHYVEYYQRGYVQLLKKKINYCKKKHLTELLEYPKYHAREFLDHLTSRMEKAS